MGTETVTMSMTETSDDFFNILNLDIFQLKLILDIFSFPKLPLILF